MEILIVDDDDINRDILKRMLRKLGYACGIAKNGAQALEILRKKSFDLIYLDCNMPGINGYDTARKIRSEERGARIPIIALTGGDETMAIYSAGMDGYLGKPWTIGDLKRSAEKWLGS